MNAAASNSASDFNQESASGSDSDSNAGDLPEYYEPISAGEDDEEEVSSDHNSDGDHEDPKYHPASNGYANCVDNGVASLDLTDDEEEETAIISSESAIETAFREDERRRNAPLPPENATRVMEAMRGISFGGVAPNWAGQVREDMWINQLTSMRQSFSSTNSTANRPT